MKLLIDAGNTRIKWALTESGSWERHGALATEHAHDLPGLLPATAAIQEIWASNVAGERVAHQIRLTARPHPACRLQFVTARAIQCGVRNGYAHADQLGSDRWCALIAAWEKLHDECLVVNSGTATTIDALSARGEFRGGLILPGIALMRRSLADATEQLEQGDGGYSAFPDNTADAILSGAIQASCGAIALQRSLLHDPAAPVILSGGSAALLHDHLEPPVHVVDDLVLQGLLLISRDTNAG